MVREPHADTTVGAEGWLQDQVYHLKGQVSQLEHQLENLRLTTTQLSDNVRAVDAPLRDASLGAAQTPRLQEELNQAVALIVQLQDQHAEMRQQLDTLGRQQRSEEVREQDDWVDVARRVDQLERRVALWQDRQAGVDEVGRRFQADVSLIQQQLQQIEKRLEVVESKAARSLEGANRAEHTLTQVDAALLELRREDEAISERARVAADVAHRLEGMLTSQLGDLQRLELLAERIELHRAERQRLEDRALRLEEELRELRTGAEVADEQRARLNVQQQGLGSRLDALQEQTDEQRAKIVEQIRKLTGSQERTKRRQIQELEREVREMRRYAAELSDQ
jgi:chromosome segregation ATPase